MSLDEKPEQTIIAIVGDGMEGTPGVSGRVFQSLGRNSINVSAIAQGASERNISLVVDASQRIQALNVIHAAFFERQKTLGGDSHRSGEHWRCVLAAVASAAKISPGTGI